MDAGTTPGVDAAPPTGNGCVNRVAAADTAYVHSAAAGGGTNAGRACMDAACHAQGGQGPQFQFAGTVYKPGGTIPSIGATIRVKTAAGVAAPDYLTDTAGNFHIPAGTLMAAFPGAKVLATACPTVAPMSTALNQGDGNCAKAGCHVAGAQGVITLADQ
ncbi:MAG TPA: hypothetical protein VHN14_01460 [Kofleriaceae bacterium]|nr:hypothetical protein [Kofleriaceae bacterium]